MNRWFFLLILLAWVPASAQYPGWSQYTNGNFVSAILDDGDKLWLGTLGAGLIHYTKATGAKVIYNRANSGIPDDWVSTMVRDSSNRLWIATQRGVAMFDGTTWAVHDTFPNGSQVPVLTSMAASPDNSIWGVATGTSRYGVLKFDGQEWSRPADTSGFAPQIVTFSVAAAKDSTIWVGTEASYLTSFNGKKWNEGETGDAFWVGTDSEGSVWYANNPGTLYRTNSSNDTSYTLDIPTTGATRRILVLSPSQVVILGEIDVKSTTHHFTMFDGTKLTPYRNPRGTVLHCVAAGANGDLYFGTNKGLAKFRDGQWEFLELDLGNLPSNQLYDVLRIGSVVWIAGQGGLTRFDGTTWATFDSSTIGISGQPVSLSRDGKGGFWVLTNEGASHFNGATWTLVPRATLISTGALLHTITADASGTIWVGTGGGRVIKYDGANVARYSPPGLTGDVKSIAIDSAGNVWMGSVQSGVAVLVAATAQFQSFNQSNSKLPSNKVNAIIPDGADGVWIGTSVGMVRFSLSAQTTFQNAPLASPFIRSLRHAPTDGALWLTTSSGLYRYDGQRWAGFTRDNSGFVDIGAVDIGPDGDVWIATTASGLTRYDARIITGVQQQLPGPLPNVLDLR